MAEQEPSAYLTMLLTDRGTGKRRVKAKQDAIQLFLETHTSSALSDDEVEEDDDWAGQNPAALKRLGDECSSSESSSEEGDSDSDSDSKVGEGEGGAGGEQSSAEGQPVAQRYGKYRRDTLVTPMVTDTSSWTPDVSSSVAAVPQRSDAHLLEFSRPTCCICLLSEGEDDPIQVCDSCGLEVHEQCYGLEWFEDAEDAPDDGDLMPWFCDSCRVGVASPVCVLCPKEGGAFKQLDVPGRWVHLLCALYNERCGWGDDESMAPIIVNRMPVTAWGARTCELCGKADDAKMGVCIKCDAGLCRTYFHVTCAQEHGLLHEVRDDASCEMPYYALCSQHADKLAVRAAKRTYHDASKRWGALARAAAVASAAPTPRYTRELLHRRKIYSAARQAWVDENRPGVAESIAFFASIAAAAKAQAQARAEAKRSNGVAALTADFVEHFLGRPTAIDQVATSCRQVRSELAALERQAAALRVAVDSGDCGVAAAREACARSAEECQHLAACIEKLTGRELRLPDVLARGLELSAALAHAAVDPSGPRPESAIVSAGSKSMARCHVCGQIGPAEAMAHCELCQRHCHLRCHDPPLTRIPRKTKFTSWQCVFCDASSEDEDEDESHKYAAAIKAGTALPGRQKRTTKRPAKFVADDSPRLAGPERNALKLAIKCSLGLSADNRAGKLRGAGKAKRAGKVKGAAKADARGKMRGTTLSANHSIKNKRHGSKAGDGAALRRAIETSRQGMRQNDGDTGRRSRRRDVSAGGGGSVAGSSSAGAGARGRSPSGRSTVE